MSIQSERKNLPVSISRGINPFKVLQNEFDRVFSNFDDLFEPFNFPKGNFENVSLLPLMDIVDDNEHFKIEMEMAGMGEKDIKVSINNGILNVKGEKTVSKQDKDKRYMSREIRYGSYERSIALPEGLDMENASASFKKGMLWIDIPKKPEFVRGSKEIPVREIKE